MKVTTTDQAIRALMQRLACENLQVLALVKLGYTARQIDAIIQPNYKCPRILARSNLRQGIAFTPTLSQ